MFLDEAPIHIPLKITSLREDFISSRLKQMDIKPGTVLSIVRKSYFGGPLIIHLGTIIIGIRREEAKNIRVTVE